MFLHTAHISILDARWHRRWNRLTINGTRERISGGEMKQFCSPPSRHNPRLDLALPTSRSPWGQLACPASRDIPIRDRLRNLRQSCNLIDKNTSNKLTSCDVPETEIHLQRSWPMYVRVCVCACVRTYVQVCLKETPSGPHLRRAAASRAASPSQLY